MTMHVDCDRCTVRGAACSGCVVTVLMGSTPDGVEWDATERAALGVLADSGLIPPLRLVTPLELRPPHEHAPGRPRRSHRAAG